MLAAFILFLSFEAAFLIAAAIYVSPLGARRTDAPPVVLTQLPRAVVIPTAWRNSHWRNR